MKRMIFFGFAILLFAACNPNKPSENQTEEASKTVSLPTEILNKKYPLEKIKLPKGFKIDVYAEVDNARSMCLSPNGTLFVGNRKGDKVYAVQDIDKNNVAEKVTVIASGLNMPCGVAFKDGSLYVAEISRILRFDDIEKTLDKPNKAVVVYDKFPKDEHHGWKFIAFGEDGKLYVPVGAPCNVCERKDNPVYSTITRMNPDGSGFEIFAKGVRNSVGFAFHPETKDLWFTDNGRDMLGDTLPSDELNHAPKAGLHFGFPYCHQGDLLDSEFGKNKKCSDFVAPAQKLGAHVAALGMRFYTGSQFPEVYKNQIFIAQHGSWNSSVKVGYRLMTTSVDKNNKVTDYQVFAEGWVQGDEAWGRPVDVLVMPDGAMLVSDDHANVVYRISYTK
ncbi:MAG: sorbosone dehydrogenase family protein [Bacteroidetes bacterium]|nr:MAG: sorbosone dehydrogenase family protein [Bacteroidota bacterium]